MAVVAHRRLPEGLPAPRSTPRTSTRPPSRAGRPSRRPQQGTAVRPGVVLAVVCAAAFAVNVDVTIMNVTLPSLVEDLGASTRELQWIVDAYTLTFAALVLAAGSLGDRFGRRGTLMVGTAVYGVGNLLASLCDTTGELIAARALMGVGAAVVFPTTLSILTNTFTERAARARAIGIWGASTGLAVALGPIAGGALLEQFDWTATFVAKVPLAVAVLVAVRLWVPTSRDPEAPRLDRLGLLLSVVFVGLLVHAVIEAPERGWSSTATLLQLAVSVVVLLGFLAHERRTTQPLLDLRLFRDRRFSISATAITVAFFALAGFIFLIVQYFQFLREYGPLATGVRTLPVAVAIAAGSVLGARLVLTIGSKVVVGSGLTTLAAAYLWISTVRLDTSYLEIALQMLLLGGGLGLTTSPATEALMSTVSTAKAGVGSAVNDTTRELGATLGVAVIGSVFATFYRRPLEDLTGLPDGVAEQAQESLGAALLTSGGLVEAGLPVQGQAVYDAASAGFLDGLAAGSLLAAAVAGVGAVVTWLLLPGRPGGSSGPRRPVTAPGSSSRHAGRHRAVSSAARAR